MNNIRVAFFVHGYFPWRPYGVPQHIASLANYLQQQGHRASVITLHRPGLLRKEVQNDGSIIIRTPYVKFIGLDRWNKWRLNIYTLGTILKGATFLRDFHPTVLHGHTVEWGGKQAALIGRMLKLPVIITLHGSALDKYSTHQKLPAKLSYLNNVDYIICQKQSAINKLSTWGISEKRCVLFRNGVDLSIFTPAPQKNYSSPKIIFVGRITRFKGADLLIEAVNMVRDVHPKVQVTVVGEGALLPKLKNQVAKLDLIQNVVFLGQRHDVPNILREHTISLSLSRYHNSTDLSLLEALASGLCVIATDVEETSEIIKNGSNGLLVPPAAREIANTLISLLDDPARVAELGYYGRKSVEADYSLISFQKKHLELYKQVSESHTEDSTVR